MHPTVELWFACFDTDAPVPPHWTACLDAREHGMAARLRHPADAHAYVARHAMLRHVLAARLGRRPRDLAFRHGPHGKPALDPMPGNAAPCFSLSRSGPFAMLAVGDAGDLGVDLERVVPTGLEAAALFTARERRELARLDRAAALDAFYRYWVCKEAVLKLLGRGLSIEPARVEISGPATPPILLALGGTDPSRIVLEVLRPREGLIAALATDAPAEVVTRTWTG